jgi:hypothetical protein
MNKRRLWVVLLILVVAAGIAVVWAYPRWQAVTGPASLLKPFLGPGECLRFELRLPTVSVGSAELRLLPAEQLDGRKVNRAVARTRSNELVSTLFPVDDRLESYIDPRLGAPWKYQKTSQEGDRYKVSWIDIDQRRHMAVHYRKRTKRDKQTAEKKLVEYPAEQIDVPERVQDPLSAYYRLRDLKLRVGETVELPVTADRHVGTLRVKVVALEKLTLSKLGELDALKIEPTMDYEGLFGSGEGVNMQMWLDAATHALIKAVVPVRIGGDLTAELIGIENTERPDLKALPLQ